MYRLFKIFFLIIFFINFSNISFSKENFYIEGVKLFEIKNFEEAKFLFERSIVFDPKHSNSYLYLAKIYNNKKDQKDEDHIDQGRYINFCFFLLKNSWFSFHLFFKVARETEGATFLAAETIFARSVASAH